MKIRAKILPNIVRKHGAQSIQKNTKTHEQFFWRSLHDICGRKFVGKSRPKTFRARKFEQ